MHYLSCCAVALLVLLRSCITCPVAQLHYLSCCAVALLVLSRSSIQGIALVFTPNWMRSAVQTLILLSSHTARLPPTPLLRSPHQVQKNTCARHGPPDTQYSTVQHITGPPTVTWESRFVPVLFPGGRTTPGVSNDNSTSVPYLFFIQASFGKFLRSLLRISVEFTAGQK